MTRTTLTFAGLAALLLTAGCGAGGDDGAGDDGGGGGSDATGACEVPLIGSTPFAAMLSGDILYDLDAGGTRDRTETLGVWFPEGRRAGAPLLVTGTGSDHRGLAVTTVVLNAHGGAQVEWSGRSDDGLQDLYFDGVLAVPGGGLAGAFHRNFADPGTDVVSDGNGSGSLCPTAAPPEPVLTTGGCAGPLSVVGYYGEVPVEPASVEAALDGDPAAVTAYGYFEGYVRVAPAQAFPPGGAPTLTVSARDVLGRSFAVEGAPTWLETSAVVSDPSFDTEPPDGAVDACAYWGASVNDGALVAEADPAYGGDVDLLVALPDPGDATSLRAVLTWTWCEPVQVAAVGADGSLEDGFMPEGYEGASVPVTVPLPEGRPVWLAVHADGSEAQPQRGPVPPCHVALEEVAFE